MNNKNLKAIIVDDCESNLSLISEMARHSGFIVECFSCSVNALEYIKKNTLDMLITDYQMPLMDGLSLVKEIRRFNVDLPVLMITGNGDDPVLLEKASRNGITAVLSKPIAYLEFIAVINEIKMRGGIKNELRGYISGRQ
ncbi:MAG TPA: hypothetical protein DHV16_07860 [Nitrospiraceae bacterium]|nr:MAG: hypothetical protein A2Z82_02405 [Nitrospirae bacterium GWA2_46_11]OGW25268.1 MAG: hypothetical protein A2X55_08745 [Nitrospirae bacterium GWB2_47_37]HAK89005.1 hypothetical protein [Nitrospiraceae bacterium]HCZ12151.1 hypothetical protein [Nitrospiraceae bacterium]